MRRKFVIVSYFTQKTGYEKEMKKLSASLHALDTDFFILPIWNQGNWFKNTAYKATFIREMLDRFRDKNIVFIDVDTKVHHYPVLFDELDCDIAYHLRIGRRNYPNGELLSGTLFFSNNANARMICDRWILENNEDPTMWEQRNLRRAIDALRSKISIKLLPASYCKIFDARTQEVEGDIVIEHFQKSREYRYKVETK